MSRELIYLPAASQDFVEGRDILSKILSSFSPAVRTALRTLFFGQYFCRLDGYHNRFGRGLIAFVRHRADGNEDIRLRKIGRGAAWRNFIRNHLEAFRPARLGLAMAD